MCDHRCTCERCKNQFETSIERERAVALILERNPLAFQPKIASGSSQHLRGCNCRKSGCMKNYCECHQAGVACTSRCTCHQCRNTETFVSAKKMLDFAGVQTDKSNRRDHPERPSQRTRVKQPLRDESRKPSALEMLSRSAPLASSRMDQKNLAISGMLDQMPLLRSIDRVDQLYSSDEVVTTPKIATRKYARQNISKITNTEQTVEANDPGKYLPNVDDTVTSAYDARNTEGCGDPELTVLCRSLLYTAKAVEIAEEDRKTDAVSSKSYSHVDQLSHALKFQGAPNPSDSRETLSPTAAGLFCEEEYSEANTTDDGHAALTPYDDEPRASTANSKSNRLNRDSRSQVSLSAMQERAVLQEFSVWLRDLVANEPSH
ncbi:hypothetical protein CCR75_002572 [Bremia lactucae]|uniref:CRC domain-containing protein n=1 Tax=Bremia lactucae TaxID=4779 RepID=A0A976IF49_BRELC|nr:hypothetical protein CCR75_002572 [Bremia lactucae]